MSEAANKIVMNSDLADEMLSEQPQSVEDLRTERKQKLAAVSSHWFTSLPPPCDRSHPVITNKALPNWARLFHR